MAVIAIAEPKIVGTGKKGIITPDSEGYYDVVLGGLDITSSDGSRYPYRGNENILSSKSPLRRRIENGQLFAELGHPVREPKMTDMDWLVRYTKVLETNHCAHIKDVRMDPDYKTNTTNESFVGILGKAKPAGPGAETAKTYLETPSINAAWSVRSFTKNIKRFDTIYKYFVEIRNWDLVTEPGIKIATKWDTPSVEEMVENDIITKDIIIGIEKLNNGISVTSTEDIEVFDTLRTAFKDTYGTKVLNRAWNTF